MSNTNAGPSTSAQTPLQSPVGNVQAEYMLAVTLSPSAVAANTSAEQTFTVTGLAVGDNVSVNKPTAQTGLAIVGFRVSAANTLAITFGNYTTASITPTASESYSVKVSRAKSNDLSNGLPSSIPS